MMNYRSFTLSVLLLLFCFTLEAQISITTDDMPAAGDTYLSSLTIDLQGIDYTSGGDNIFWDFTGLTEQFQEADTFVSTLNVPLGYQFTFIPFLVSNLATEIANIDFQGFPVSDPYRFYNNNGDAFTDLGQAISLYGIPIAMKYNTPDLVYDFPLEYSDEFSSIAEYEVNVPSLIYIYSKRERENMVDGWGIIKTPFGEFEVLRIASHVINYDSIYLDSLSVGFPINQDYMEYKWLAKESGIPIMEIYESAVLLTATYQDSLRGPAGINSLSEEDLQMSVFPNPVHDQNIQLQTHFKDAQIIRPMLIDMSGKIVAEPDEMLIEAGDQQNRINLKSSHEHKGSYLLVIRGEGFLKTIKILII